jgi:hypothetical protein
MSSANAGNASKTPIDRTAFAPIERGRKQTQEVLQKKKKKGKIEDPHIVGPGVANRIAAVNPGETRPKNKRKAPLDMCNPRGDIARRWQAAAQKTTQNRARNGNQGNTPRGNQTPRGTGNESRNQTPRGHIISKSGPGKKAKPLEMVPRCKTPLRKVEIIHTARGLGGLKSANVLRKRKENLDNPFDPKEVM